MNWELKNLWMTRAIGLVQGIIQVNSYHLYKIKNPRIPVRSYLDRSSHWWAACSLSCSCTQSFPLCSGKSDHSCRYSCGTRRYLEQNQCSRTQAIKYWNRKKLLIFQHVWGKCYILKVSALISVTKHLHCLRLNVCGPSRIILLAVKNNISSAFSDWLSICKSD